jgi:uncharacterized protein YecE (DUF72 family)
MARILVGTSGWVYGGWQDRFYPPGLPNAQRLSFYANRFETTEVNYSFYHLPKAETYRKWATLVSEDFVFSIKANRAITHVARLRNVEKTWNEFVRSATELRQHLGPILIQLPPSFRQDHVCLSAFLEMTSGTSTAVRLAFEFRHASWFTDETYRLLTRYGSALCIADSVRYPRRNEVTTNFTYLRFHGRTPRHAPFYADDQLRHEAEFIDRLTWQGIETYVYFNNDVQAHAPTNAARLRELLNELRDMR